MDYKRINPTAQRYAEYYIRNVLHYTIIDAQYQCDAGSIDIIAFDTANLLFIVVVDSESDVFEEPTADQRQSVEAAAIQWLLENNPSSTPVRFDVISVVGGTSTSQAVIRYHTGAFAAS